MAVETRIMERSESGKWGDDPKAVAQSPWRARLPSAGMIRIRFQGSTADPAVLSARLTRTPPTDPRLCLSIARTAEAFSTGLAVLPPWRITCSLLF